MTIAAAWGEQSLVDELLQALDDDPSSVEARRLLIHQYLNLGWTDAAADLAEEILQDEPDDIDALQVLQAYGQDPPKSVSPPKATPSMLDRHSNVGDLPPSSQDVDKLMEQYEDLQKEAEILLQEMSILQDMAPELDYSEQLADLVAMYEGRMFSVAQRKVDRASYVFLPAMVSAFKQTKFQSSKSTSKLKAHNSSKGGAKITMESDANGVSGVPQSARALAKAIKDDSDRALDIIMEDFKSLIAWQRLNDSTTTDDTLRTTLRRRTEAINSSLPREMSHIPTVAFMHAEHEHLNKTYANTETMYGDPVPSIPRENFWTSEDGYAWDMEELVAAIAASKGSLRNPLSKEQFSATDIEAIVRHPLGKSVGAVQIEQRKLKQGVRPETVTRLRTMATILLEDNSENSFPSHAAVEEFLSYVATLPEAERTAIDKLKVPAVDSHTRQPFDDTIGDAVRDAKGNRICFHKAGDLLQQAATYLSRS